MALIRYSHGYRRLEGMINADDWYALDAVEVMMNNGSAKNDVRCGNIMLIGNKWIEREKKSKVGWLNLVCTLCTLPALSGKKFTRKRASMISA